MSNVIKLRIKRDDRGVAIVHCINLRLKLIDVLAVYVFNGKLVWVKSYSCSQNEISTEVEAKYLA